MNPLRIIYSTSNDPWFNLAVEETIFNEMESNQNVLFLWRNDRAIIIGRAQNPWKECNTKKMQQDNIKLARRSSGGGAVYHDLGNSCFTFMAGKSSYHKNDFIEIVLNSLSLLGIQAKQSGRNDLTIETENGERKISGSAFKEKFDRGFYHGTLLINADLTRLADYLNPDPKKLQSKGISSVRARVTNLNEFYPKLTHESFCFAMQQTFIDFYQKSATLEYISPKKIPNLPNFENQFKLQSSWDWNFGKAPEFTHFLNERFYFGGFELYFNVENGKINDLKLFTDSLNPTIFEQIIQNLKNQYYHPNSILKIKNNFNNNQTEIYEFLNWLEQNIN